MLPLPSTSGAPNQPDLKPTWCGSLVRDEGQVFHVEAFVVPRRGAGLTPSRLAGAREGCAGIDWKLADTVLIPVETLPEEVGGHRGVHQSGKEE